ncbi:MAG: arginine decarboxylase, pyruvoyl-dependent [Desulfomonile tiedjei]|nr:arginine decarboxylase, pyruvoyl-dependent [Desulfomonile tiedjei]
MFGPPATRFFLTSGYGEASTSLNAFDAALLKAKVGDTNLVKLSSILPPRCAEIQPYELPKGSLVPLAYGALVCEDAGTVISASVAVGIPEDSEAAGLIMECAQIGGPQGCERSVREMVQEGMETIRGVRIREIKSISATLTVQRVGAVFAAVVLCP